METVKLEPEFKTKWLEALRSGKYVQGIGCLHNIQLNTYCCLGVAGEVLGLTKAKMEGAGTLSEDWLGEESKNIPDAIRGNGSIDVDDYNPTVETLVEMNDGGGDINNKKSFAEIANWIEENL